MVLERYTSILPSISISPKQGTARSLVTGALQSGEPQGEDRSIHKPTASSCRYVRVWTFGVNSGSKEKVCYVEVTWSSKRPHSCTSFRDVILMQKGGREILYVSRLYHTFAVDDWAKVDFIAGHKKKIKEVRSVGSENGWVTLMCVSRVSVDHRRLMWVRAKKGIISWRVKCAIIRGLKIAYYCWL